MALVEDLEDVPMLPFVLQELIEDAQRGLTGAGNSSANSFQMSPHMVGESSLGIKPTPAEGTCVLALAFWLHSCNMR